MTKRTLARNPVSFVTSKRSGKVAYDRPKTVLIGDERGEMDVTFYVHANPVMANMVADAKQYFFSTHRLYAYGTRDIVSLNVVFPAWYMALGRTWKLRQKRYRQLFDAYLKRKIARLIFLSRFFYGPLKWEIAQTKKLRTWRKSLAKAKDPP